MFVLECVCFNLYLCMGVCFSCGPSIGHKAGSVCPLGCWNVHFGQQAASVLNRSCPSYCTSRTMSFSLPLCPSLSVFLSLWPYTDSVSDERLEELDSDWLFRPWCPCHCFSVSSCLTTHYHQQRHQNRVETWPLIGFITPLLLKTCLVIQGINTSHCRRGTISPGTPHWLCVCMYACLWVCMREGKEEDVLKRVYGCSPIVVLLTWWPKINKTTWYPHDLSTIIMEVPCNSPFLWRDRVGGQKVLLLTCFIPVPSFKWYAH